MSIQLDGDYVPLFRDDASWAALVEALAPYYHEDVECMAIRFDDEATYKGLEGVRALWLDWLAPWASYRVESHDVVDLGDQVLLPAYNNGGPNSRYVMRRRRRQRARGGRSTSHPPP